MIGQGFARRLATLCGIALVALGTAAAGTGSGGYTLRLDFTNADGVVKGNDVLIYGVKAGSVQDLTLRDSLAVITVSIDQSFAPLHAGTKAVVRSLGLLGNHYVEVIPGPASGPELAEGAEIDITSTTSPTDLDQFNAVFDAPTREKIKEATLQGQIALGARAKVLNRDLAQLRNLAVAAEPLTGVLDQHQVALDRATVAFDTLTQKLVREDAALGSLVDHGNSVLSSLQQEDAQLGGLLQHGDTSLGRLDQVLSGNESNLAGFLARQPQALRDLDYNAVSATPDLENATPLLPDLYNLIYEMGDANVSITGPGNPQTPGSGSLWLLRVLATPCVAVVPQGGQC